MSAHRRSAKFNRRRDDIAAPIVHARSMLQALGHASMRHPRRTLAVWFLVLVASFVAAPVLFSSLTSDMGGGDSSESARADARRDELFRQLPPRDRAEEGFDTVIGVVAGLSVHGRPTGSAVS